MTWQTEMKIEGTEGDDVPDRRMMHASGKVLGGANDSCSQGYTRGLQ